MMNTPDEAPFSIAVALPTPLKSLVERMLHGLLREQPQQAARWHLRDAGDTDVTFRLHGGDGQSISPNLLADVRSRDGRSETLVIEGAWRAGVLSAAGILAGHGKSAETSPILRGRFVAEQILCVPVPPPPDNVEPLPPIDGKGLTTRQRFQAHSAAACWGVRC